MANRTVEVSLRLKAEQFKAEAESAKRSTEGLDDKIKDTDRDLKKLPPDAAKAAAAMKLLGDESGNAGLKLDNLNKRTSLGVLDQKIVKTRAEVKALAEEFNKTGDAGVLRNLFKSEAGLQELEKLKKVLAVALSDGGKQAGPGFIASFVSALKLTGGPTLATALAAVVLSAAAFAGAALNAGLLAGLAGGGLALGIIGQLKSQAVQSAWAQAGRTISDQLTHATVGFREPLIGAAHILRDDIGQAINSIHFDRLAEEVEPFARGLGALATHTVPGLNEAFDAGAGILHKLASQLPSIGDALSDMFRKFAQGAAGAQEGMRTLVLTINFLLRASGDVLLLLSKMYDRIVSVGEKFSWWTASIFTGIPVIGGFTNALHDMFDTMKRGDAGTEILVHKGETLADALRRVNAEAASTAEGMDKLAAAASKTAATADTVAAAMIGKAFNAIMTADQATLGWHKSLLDLHDTLDQNGKAIDRHTGLVDLNSKAGLANREAVLAAMTANMQIYQAQIALGGNTEDATKAFEANTAALEAQLRAAGYNTKQIDDMIGSLKGVPKKTETEIAMHGLTEAINNLGNLIADLNGFNGRSYGFTVTEKHVYESDYVTTRQGERGNRWGGIYQHAAAGLLNAKVYSPMGPARYAFAEPATGGEAFVPRFGDYRRSTSILDQAARWYGGRFAPGGMGGGGGTVVNYALTVNAGMGANGQDVGSTVIAAIKRYEQSNGKNWRN